MLHSRSLLLASLLALAPVAARANQDFTLINRTGYPIDRIYVSQTIDHQWGNDALSTAGLNDGERTSINLPSHQRVCQYDLRVEYHDGLKATWSGLNLCDIPKISLFWNNKTRTTTAEPG